MKLDLSVGKKTFESLFREYTKLEIPDFQRPYEWTADHWSDLWNDVTENLSNEYLMGGIVLCGNDNGGSYVIDGQQRITTMSLWIAVCRDYLWKECETEEAKSAAREFHKDHIVRGGILAEKNEPYIILSEADRLWFGERIQVSPADAQYAPPDLGKVSYKLPSSNRLLWKAYKFFYQKLKERHSKSAFPSVDKKVSDIIAITRQLAQKTWFVATHVPDDTQAYTLFEVLNDRGLELSISDLIKNKILSRAAELQRLSKAKDYWTEIVEMLDHENVAPFLRYHWMSHNGKKTTENALFPKLKDEIKGMNANGLISFLNTLSVEAEYFQEIIGRADVSAEIERELGFINSYGFRVGNTALLAIWASTNEEKIRLSALKEIKNFLVKYAIFANQVTNELETVMAEISRAIRKDLSTGLDEMKLRFKKTLPSRDSIKGGFLSLEPSISVARTLLTEIEIHLAGTEKMVSGPKQVNVEHIFPQSPGPEWRKSFGVESSAEESYMGRLGNLTLLHQKLNKQASNKKYSDKRKAYYAKSDLTVTKRLPKTSTWTFKSVDERQKDFYDLAKKIWRIE